MTGHKTRKWTLTIPGLLITCLIAACGGGSGSIDEPAADVQAISTECDPQNAATLDQCGVVYIGLTDADGDFLNYTVDVVQLTLETANGRTVETLPRSTRINFTDYVDLTELVTAATIPPATYVAGTITLDYTAAEVFVEAAGDAKEATVSDASGAPLERTELRIELANRDRLIVSRGRPSLLQLDFDLAASHVVDIVPTPAIAVADTFIVAEVTPVDEKDIRIRGPLIEVNEADSSYTVAIRPFHDRDGDFGQVSVLTSDDSEYEINGEMFSGADGLAALELAGVATPTVAAGTLDIEAREFSAAVVLAGSSVPGAERDAVIGNVIARDGDTLTVRGATVLSSDRAPHFHDDVTVLIGPETRIVKDGDRVSDLSSNAISVGQRVTVRGDVQGDVVTDAASSQVVIDATEGAVRLHVTRLAGTVNSFVPGQVDITLHSIDRRRSEVFDFTGTGTAPETNADPDNYEVSTGDLALIDLADSIGGTPLVAFGFPTAFGSAPPDFAGRTIVEYSDVRSKLGLGWGEEGTTAPFLSIGGDGLLLDNQNESIGTRHYIRQGPILIDLTALDSDTLIVPRTSDRTLFSIKSPTSIRQYTVFDDFVEDLSLSLNGATSARSMHAHGTYDSSTNTFTAFRIGIVLLENGQ